MKEISNIRNIAIIAHVDHGKTTLVDEMLKQSGVFRQNQEVAERVMDNNDLEREKGITILAKNTSVFRDDIKINIVDTPGHADFSGEVERILKMVNGVLLLVDAFEGPMPQTRFVLQKALELNLKVIIGVNKTDRPDARPLDAALETIELLEELNATPEQLDSPIVYCSARSGLASMDPDNLGETLDPLFDTIISHIEPPVADQDGPLQLLISSVDYNSFVGRIGIGRVDRGSIRAGKQVMVANYYDEEKPYQGKVNNLFAIEGLKRVAIDESPAGDIVCFSGIESINIGDTICDLENVEPIPFVKVGEPTVEMIFSVNDSPYAGTEGDFVTSRQLRDRLFKELLKDVSLRVFETESTDGFRVLGRGEMHLAVLIETMRREGYEFSVSPPRALFKEIDGKVHEPIERLQVDVPEESFHCIAEKMGKRKGLLVDMAPSGKRMKAQYLIPSRGLFGYRSEFLTDTCGEGIMGAVFEEYQEYKGKINQRETGSLVAWETGVAVAYGLFNAQERGQLFIKAGTKVYEGMIVGITTRREDVSVNVCKKKQLTNTRSSGADDSLRLVPPRELSLEQCLEYMTEDELLEITPKNLRLRKKIMNKTARERMAGRSK